LPASRPRVPNGFPLWVPQSAAHEAPKRWVRSVCGPWVPSGFPLWVPQSGAHVAPGDKMLGVPRGVPICCSQFMARVGPTRFPLLCAGWDCIRFYKKNCFFRKQVHVGVNLRTPFLQGVILLGGRGANLGLASPKCDIIHCLTNSKHRHIDTKRTWPTKYAKMPPIILC